MSDSIGFNSILQYGTAPAATCSTWTTLGKKLKFSPPQQKASDIKTSSIDDTDVAHTYIAGREEPGDMKCSLKYDASDAGTVTGMKRVLKAWRIQLADGAHSGMKFDGYINEFGLTEVTDENLNQTDFNIKGSGPVAYFATSTLSVQNPEA